MPKLKVGLDDSTLDIVESPCCSSFGAAEKLGLASERFGRMAGAGLPVFEGAGDASLDGLREDEGLSKLVDAFRESTVLPVRFFNRGAEPVGLGRPRLLLGCFVVEGIRIRPLHKSSAQDCLKHQSNGLEQSRGSRSDSCSGKLSLRGRRSQGRAWSSSIEKGLFADREIA